MKQEIQNLKGPIAVFGAGGFIGANLLRALVDVREDAFGIVRSAYTPWRLLDLPAEALAACDVNHPEQVEALFRRYRFQTIFYLAAYGAYSKQKDATKIYQTNVLGLLNVGEAARDVGGATLIHSGSSSEYGLACRGPKETEHQRPNSDYAVSKVSASYLIQYWGECLQMRALNLRLYSIYGPWEEPDRLIPMVIEKGLEKKYPPLVDAEISRDFVYIDDCVEAFVRAGQPNATWTPGSSINISTGKKTTIGEVARTAKELFSIPTEPEWQSMPNRGWDLRDWYGDPTLAKSALGWEAKTPLREGLAKTASWQKSRPFAPSAEVARPVVEGKRLSVIIACYRDAEAIPIMHRRLTDVFRRVAVDYEIIFINDSSPDDTDSVLARLCAEDKHVVGVEHSRNFGSQSGFLSGMEVATGDAVVLMDGDLQDPPELIPQFLEKWNEGYEVVYGRRVRREMSFLLGLCYKAFYRMFRTLAYVPVPLDAGDFSLLDRKVVNELLALPETDQFLRGLRAWVGFKQTGVDYVRPERMFGRSTNNWRKNFWWARKAIFSFSFAPLEGLLYFGIGLTLLSFTGLIAQTLWRIYHPNTPAGITTVINLILLFGGFQMLAIATLGEYLAKIFDEVKRRPKFIRRAIRAGGRHMTLASEIQEFIAGRRT